MSDWFSIGGAALGGLTSIFGGRRQQSAANAQAAASMQFERENMFHQNQVALDFANHQNRFNAGQAQEARDWNAAQSGIERTFNAEEAAKNRAFQEQMSNTQYQRAASDMKAAGFNPMLAYSQGGAGNVSGASASTSAPTTSPASGSAAGPSGLARGAQAQQLNYLMSGVNTAATVGQNVAAVKEINARAEKTSAEADVLKLLMEGIPEVDPKTGRVRVGPGGYYRSMIRQQYSTEAKSAHDAEKAGYEAEGAKQTPEQQAIATAMDRLGLKYYGMEGEAKKGDEQFNKMLNEMFTGGRNTADSMMGFLRMALPLILKAVQGQKPVNIYRR